jgi:flavin reductase (DIM6/NTAB) family NADH-FMN oxidoreductase RutF
LHSRARSCYKKLVIGPDDFRKVLGHFASGVTIITTIGGDGRPTGLTASAFTSLSLEPPLILVCVAHKSQSYPALLERGRFAVNVLRREQEDLSRRFATSRLDKFDGVPHRITELGLPVLEDALAHVECVTVSKHVEGDHTVFIGRVDGCGTTDGMPLLYYRGKYESLRGD